MTLVVPERRIEPSDKTLYRHTKRPGWGVAIIVRQRKDRRTYQFSDGQLRVIKEPFYTLLEPVEEVAGSAETLRSDLARAARSNQASTSPSIGKPVCTFEEQLELFHGLYPDGFSDPQWIHHHRSSADGNTYKRHRNPVVAAMSETLAEERCRDLIEADRSGELIPPVAQILTTTTLVPIKHARALARLDEGERAQCGAVLHDLLYGEGPYGPRFKAWIKALRETLGHQPSWRVATAIPALVQSQDHVCVRRATFDRQATSLAPISVYSRRPQPRAYESYRQLAHAVRHRLQAAGEEPRDLLDVHDFVWATLRRSALEQLGST